ncbi:MAG: hypothetical protein JXO22_07425 [Phycisphaerae bacterium]|nr:hypothetical protein [Phycisphaerae bacterium]
MLRCKKMLILLSSVGLLLQSGACQMFADAFNAGWNIGNAYMGTDMESPFADLGSTP